MIVGLLVAAVTFDQRDDTERARRRPGAAATAGATLARLIPVGPPADALGSAWFCAGGSTNEDGPAAHTVVVANFGDAVARGRISAFTATGPDGTRALDVAPRTTVRVPVRELLESGADWAAAEVEVDSGQVAVEHEVVGEHGRDVAPCATDGSTRWYFPSGATTRDARLVLAVYNPFPDPAAVDVAFATEDGPRLPRAFQGVPVPARSVTTLDVTDVVTVRAVLATTVRARIGRVVVDRVQTYDGRGASTTDEEAEDEAYRRRGLTITAGVPTARPVWWFPAGAKSRGVHERVTVFNPGSATAEVEIQVDLDEPERNGVLDPFALDVSPGEFREFLVDDEDTIPSGITHSLIVRSIDERDIVVERWFDSAEPASYTGVATSTGSPVAAPGWVFPSGSGEEAVERIVLRNPTARALTVRLAAFGDGRRVPAPGTSVVRLEPGARADVELDDLADDRASVIVRANGPIVAERRIIARGEAALGASTALGIALPAGLVAAPETAG